MLNTVCFILPRLRSISGDPPLGLCSLAAVLRKALPSLRVRILDTTFHPSLEYVKEYLNKERPQAVAIYTSTPLWKDVLAVARIAQEIGALVIVGGPHATVLPESIISMVNVVVIGEGEQTIVELAEKLPHGDLSGVQGIWYKDSQGKVKKNDPREPIQDLNWLPFPAFDLIDLKRYFNYWHYLDSVASGVRGTNLMASRGCYGSCSFCQPTINKIFGKKVRYLSPSYLVDEIEYLMQSYGIHSFFFQDDSFTANRQWAEDFFAQLRSRSVSIIWGCNSRIDTVDEDLLHKMYDAGARVVYFGIESGSQRILDQVYCKKISLDQVKEAVWAAHRVGLRSCGLFMLGAADETRDEVEKTISLAVSLPLDSAVFSVFTPIPGTDIFNSMNQDGRYEISRDFSDFNYYKSLVFSGGSLNKHQVRSLQWKAIVLFYFHPKRWRFVFSHFLSLRGIFRFYLKIKRIM